MSRHSVCHLLQNTCISAFISRLVISVYPAAGSIFRPGSSRRETGHLFPISGLFTSNKITQSNQYVHPSLGACAGAGGGCLCRVTSVSRRNCRMIGWCSFKEGAHRWLCYSTGLRRIRGQFSRRSVGEPSVRSIRLPSAGSSPDGSRLPDRLRASRSSQRSHGIIFMSGSGRRFPGVEERTDPRAAENR